ncbi:MAG: nucleoside triphosphate pyrophosphohydrolase [Rhodospirillales bacterium]
MAARATFPSPFGFASLPAMKTLSPKPSVDVTPLERLLAIMARLRDPETGCPWDVAQDFSSIAPYTIEEAYEVAEAIAQQDLPSLKDELGDLLLQVVFHARIAEEAGHFTFQDVAETIAEKMVRRHPHVFGDGVAKEGDAVSWESIKAEERAAKGGGAASQLDGVALALPALLRAAKLQKRAARVGFDWPDAAKVLAKVEEELAELRAEIAALPDDPAARARAEEELGDLLFVLANLSRHLSLDPESALRKANAKFERRFHFIEAALAAQERSPEDASLEELEALWLAAKKQYVTDGN